MSIPHNFVKMHCPCGRSCAKRHQGCHSVCQEWAEWEILREATRRRILIESSRNRYDGEQREKAINRRVMFLKKRPRK